MYSFLVISAFLPPLSAPSFFRQSSKNQNPALSLSCRTKCSFDTPHSSGQRVCLACVFGSSKTEVQNFPHKDHDIVIHITTKCAGSKRKQNNSLPMCREPLNFLCRSPNPMHSVTKPTFVQYVLDEEEYMHVYTIGK
jgi:hypothetical protein